MALSNSKGWSVVLAGTGINLALGVLYTWSIFKGAISDSIKQGGPDAFQWDLASINDPYAVCCLMFAFSMILAGKCQDRIGPRMTAMIGGLLVGAGFILLSQTTNYWLWVVGFGVLAGMGFGFGYSSATPPALKWFPPAKIAIPVIGAEHPSATLLVVVATLIGFNYGANLALFPAITKDFWGLKSFGANYGLLFTAWGVGGFVLGRASEMMKAATGDFTLSFGVAGMLLTVAALALVLKDLFNQMVQAQVAKELAQRAEVAKVAVQEPVFKPALEQAA